MLGCEGDSNAGVGSGGCVVAMSAYMGGTRSSGVLSSACDVLEMGVVKGVGGVTCVCVCLGAGWEVEWVTGLGYISSGGTWGKWDMCLCFGCGCLGGIGGSGWSAWAKVWEGGVVLCLCVL